MSQPEPELEPESAQGDDREKGEDTTQPLRWWERPDVLARMRCDPSTGDETSHQVMLSKYQISSSRFAIAMTCVVTGARTINLTYSNMHD